MKPYRSPWPSMVNPLDRTDGVSGLTARWVVLPGRVGGKRFADCSGNGFDFNLAAGTAAWSGDTYPGGFGSVTFDGSTYYTAAPGTANPTGLITVTAGKAGPFTAVLWAKVTSFADFRGLLSARSGLGSGWTLGTDITTGKMRAFGSSAALSATAVPLNTWVHLAYTLTGAGVAGFFLNGVSAGGGGGTGTAQATSIVTLGCLATNANLLSGSIGEVRVYNRILAAAEIAALYNTARDGLNYASTAWRVAAAGPSVPLLDGLYRRRRVG